MINKKKGEGLHGTLCQQKAYLSLCSFSPYPFPSICSRLECGEIHAPSRQPYQNFLSIIMDSRSSSIKAWVPPQMGVTKNVTHFFATNVLSILLNKCYYGCLLWYKPHTVQAKGLHESAYHTQPLILEKRDRGP